MTSTKLRLQSFPRSWRAHRRNKSPKYGAERGTLSSSHRWSGDITQSLSFSFSFLFVFGSLSLSLCFLSISLHRAITTVLPIAWPAYLRHIGKHRLEAQLTMLQHPSYLYFLQCCLQIPEYGMQKSLYSAKSWKFTAYKRREKKTVVTVGWSEQVWATDQEREEQHLGTQGHCTALVLTELLCKKSCPHLYMTVLYI